MVINRTRERIKKTAEVFTPEWLVDEILMKLYKRDRTLFTSATKTFLDPAAGDGNFLVRILHFKYEFSLQRNGKKKVPLKEIVASIYGVDLMPDNVKQARHRMLEALAAIRHISYEDARKEFGRILMKNIVCHNALEWDFENWRPKNAMKDLLGVIGLEPARKPAPETVPTKPEQGKVPVTDADEFFPMQRNFDLAGQNVTA